VGEIVIDFAEFYGTVCIVPGNGAERCGERHEVDADDVAQQRVQIDVIMFECFCADVECFSELAERHVLWPVDGEQFLTDDLDAVALLELPGGEEDWVGIGIACEGTQDAGGDFHS